MNGSSCPDSLRRLSNPVKHRVVDAPSRARMRIRMLRWSDTLGTGIDRDRHDPLGDTTTGLTALSRLGETNEKWDLVQSIPEILAQPRHQSSTSSSQSHWHDDIPSVFYPNPSNQRTAVRISEVYLNGFLHNRSEDIQQIPDIESDDQLGPLV